MRPRLLLALSLVLTTVFGVEPARAQTSARRLIEDAREQIDELNIDSAGALLRAALDPASDAGRGDRMRGLVLLGITELILGREQGARQAFRQALVLDPTLRVDSLADLSSDLPSIFNGERAAVSDAAPTQLGVLQVQGMPADAELQVNGIPWSVPRQQVAEGLYRIQVAARGFLAYRDSVFVQSGAIVVRTVQMVELEPAQLSVTSATWGTLFLDGQRIGETPIVERRVLAGPYVLTIEMPGRPVYQQQIDLEPGSHTRLAMLGRTVPAERAAFPFTRADSLYDAAEFDRAVTLYGRIVHDENLQLTGLQRARAATRVGVVYSARGRSRDEPALFDSAQVYFRRAYALAPQFAPGSGEMGPELRTTWELARETAFRFAVEMVEDTIYGHDEVRLRAIVTPTRPARVTLEIVDAAGGLLWREAQQLEGVGTFDWDGRIAGATTVAFGSHSLRVTAVDSQGEAAPAIAYAVNVQAEAVDTIVAPPPPIGLPESKAVFRVGRVAAGVLFGAAAALLPLWSGHNFERVASHDEPEAAHLPALVVAGSVTIGGIIGFFAGRKEKPLPENAERNRVMREEDAAMRRGIADQNVVLRAQARIRVRTRRTR